MAADTLFVSNYSSKTVSKITEDGKVTQFATVTPLPFGLAFDSQGRLYAAIGQMTNRISRISATGSVTTFAALPRAFDATAIAFDRHGTLFVASQGGLGVQRISRTGQVSAFSGGFSLPFGLAFDRDGNLFVSDSMNGTVKQVSPAGVMSNFKSGFSTPKGLAFDAAGNLYVADANRVSRITPAGVVTTFASGFVGPTGIAFDTTGNLYVVNQSIGTVSKVTPEGAVSTFASGLNSPLFVAVQPDVAPPKLTLPAQSGDDIALHGAKVTLQGGITLFYEVLFSDDLATWTSLDAVQIVGTKAVELVDPTASSGTQRFYRARALP